MKKKNLAAVISVIMILSTLIGCSPSEDDGKDDNIELKAPVGVSADYDYVTTRDMYMVDVYPSSVNPVVTEYAFSKDQVFKGYGAIPGEAVEAGDTLVYSETKSLDKRKEEIDEQIDDAKTNQEIELVKQEKDLADAIKNEKEAKEDYEKILILEPDPCTIEHDMWENQIHWPEFSYKNAIQRRECLEETIKQQRELYALEYDYLLGNKQRVQEKVIDTTVVTNTSGEIVACNYFQNGETIAKDTPILAVGDTSVKVLQTEYITKGTIAKALDVYAIINGKRYEIEYIPMEPEEHQQLVDEDESVHTTFVLEDPYDEATIGTYAVVVVENDRRHGVLCVPNDALKKESDGYYVYLYNDDQSSYVPVEIGMRDGMYAEVLSGLSLGDKVLSGNVPKISKNTAQVTRGDYSIETEINGFLYYPFSEWLLNPAQNGTTYLKEMLVSENERVEKDQVIATLEVIPDKIEIGRLNTQISRLQSRHDEMMVTKAACEAKELTSYELDINISENERDIKLKKRELSKISKYSGIIEIKAPYSGVIMQLESIKPGDLLLPDARILEMGNDSTSFVIVKDEKNQLNYGSDADVTVSGSSGPVTIKGKVVTVNKMCLSKKMTNDYSLIAIPQEEMNSIAGSVRIESGMWSRSNFKVKVKVRSEKNVLMIPKAAVTLKDKSTYVTVVNSDGSIERKSFIPGGSDNNNYWIVDGLTEGAKVCWE